jgi:hypothetical protein
MNIDLHFILKVSADLFGSLVLTISAQPYFQSPNSQTLRNDSWAESVNARFPNIVADIFN